MNGITIDIFPHLLFRGVFSPEGKWSLGGLMMQSDKKTPFWSYLEVHMMVVLMVVFMVNIFCQIFFRVLFKTPVFFAEELSRYAFLWMVFLGLSYATLHDKHIRVTLLVEKFPFTLQRITEILIHLLAIACFCWIGVTSISWLKFISGSVTNAMRIPRWILGLILPLSAVLVVIRSIQKIVACCRTIAAHRKEDEFE
mgnify:FL=1